VEDSVVARYPNGRVVKGVTRDFHPNRGAFHIYPTEQTYLKKGVEIVTSELKALFFVKTLEGNPQYIKARSFRDTYQKSKGRQCVVAFKDGEILYAYSQSYDARKPGFFVFPADENDNNNRIYVVREAIIGIQFVDMGDRDSEVDRNGVVRGKDPVPAPEAAPAKDVVEETEAPASEGTEAFRENVRRDYEEILNHYKHGHEREFSRSFQKLLKHVWFEEVTKHLTKRGLLSFGRKTRYFARGGIKEMGRSDDRGIGWPEFEAVPKFTNSLSEVFSRGKRLEHFSMDERERMRKYINRVHNDLSEPIYLVAGGLVVWDGFELAFYDSREEFYTIFTKKKSDGIFEQVNGLTYFESRILINDVPIPIAINDKVILAFSWERNFSFHPSNPVKRFS